MSHAAGVAFAVLACAATNLFSQSRGGTPPQTATATVSGQVVAADTGQPIAGATVRASILLAAAAGGPPPAPVQTTSDEAGRFTLVGLMPGSLNLTASAEGYLLTTYRPRQASQIPQIQAGQHLTDVTLSLPKAARLSGLVLDESGKPMPGIEVHAYRRGILTVRRVWQDARTTFRTDASGRYTVSNVQPGEYVVSVPVVSTTQRPAVLAALNAIPRADFDASPIVQAIVASRAPLPSAAFQSLAPDGTMLTNGMAALPMPTPARSPGSAPQIYRTTYFPAATTLDAAGIITIAGGEARADVNITLQRSTSFRVSGALRRGATPVAFTGVHLIAEDAAERSIDYDTVVALTTTGLDGGFAFQHVPPGNYSVKVVVLPVPPGAGNAVLPPANRLTSWASESVRVSDADVVLGDVALHSPVTISGRVEFAGGGSVSPAASGRSTVWLAAMDGGMYSPPAAVEIQPDGRFVLKGAMRSRYHLWGASYPGWTVSSVTAAGVDITIHALAVGDRDIDDVVVTMTNRPTMVTGGVVHENGTSVTGAEVLVFPSALTAWIANGQSMRGLRRVRTDGVGRFSAGGLPPGSYLVAALPEGSAHDYPDRRLFEAAEKVARSVILLEGKPADVKLLVGSRR